MLTLTLFPFSQNLNYLYQFMKSLQKHLQRSHWSYLLNMRLSQSEMQINMTRLKKKDENDQVLHHTCTVSIWLIKDKLWPCWFCIPHKAWQTPASPVAMPTPVVIRELVGHVLSLLLCAWIILEEHFYNEHIELLKHFFDAYLLYYISSSFGLMLPYKWYIQKHSGNQVHMEHSPTYFFSLL